MPKYNARPRAKQTGGAKPPYVSRPHRDNVNDDAGAKKAWKESRAKRKDAPKKSWTQAAPAQGDAAPATSWNKVADWYGSHLQKEDTFQDTLVFPGALRLLNVEKGKQYLDIACGEGSFAKLIVGKGAGVTGFDAAPALVKRAQSKHLHGATFYMADASRFSQVLRGATFDGATCILAIQNIQKVAETFAEASKALKPGAPLVIVMNHPVLRIPRQSSWGWDETKKLQYRRIDMYMSETVIPIQMRPGDDPHVKTLSYHRPLQTYVMALAKTGFVIDALEEWTSNRNSDSGPRAKAENRTRNEVPMFMAIRARKM